MVPLMVQVFWESEALPHPEEVVRLAKLSWAWARRTRDQRLVHSATDGEDTKKRSAVSAPVRARRATLCPRESNRAVKKDRWVCVSCFLVAERANREGVSL